MALSSNATSLPARAIPVPSGLLLSRILAILTLAILVLALLPGMTGTADAARSSKPKEIVVVGSKVKESGQERPVRAVLDIVADRLLSEEERLLVQDAMPEVLDDLCPARTAGEACKTAEIEALLHDRVLGVLDGFDGLGLEELSVHLAARRDGGSPAQMLAPALLVYGLLRWQRGNRTDLYPGGLS